MSTEHYKWRKKVAKRAREKHLDRLYVEQNSLCWWCKSACVLLRYVPPDAVVCHVHGSVQWRDGDFVLEGRIGTVDHVLPVRDGGDNDAENLVMACMECNGRRTNTPSPKPDGIRKICPDCNGPKPAKFRRCGLCSVRKQRAWLASHGWKEVASNDIAHSKFRDPATGVDHILSRACRELGRRLGGGQRTPGTLQEKPDMEDL
jgi:5-methylcytosine-specific restriction endonuclease McrA